MSKITINVKIANRFYKLKASNDKEEELIRKAAELINIKIKEYSSSYSFNDEQDLLAMVSLHYTTEFLNKNKNEDFIDKDLIDKLQQLNTLVDNNM